MGRIQLITWAAVCGFLVGLTWGLGREPRWVETHNTDWYLP